MASLHLRFLVIVCILSAFGLFSDPCECRRVIFYSPRDYVFKTGQILSTNPRETPCPKCHKRDHRGNCRRLMHTEKKCV